MSSTSLHAVNFLILGGQLDEVKQAVKNPIHGRLCRRSEDASVDAIFATNPEAEAIVECVICAFAHGVEEKEWMYIAISLLLKIPETMQERLVNIPQFPDNIVHKIACGWVYSYMFKRTHDPDRDPIRIADRLMELGCKPHLKLTMDMMWSILEENENREDENGEIQNGTTAWNETVINVFQLAVEKHHAEIPTDFIDFCVQIEDYDRASWAFARGASLGEMTLKEWLYKRQGCNEDDTFRMIRFLIKKANETYSDSDEEDVPFCKIAFKEEILRAQQKRA